MRDHDETTLWKAIGQSEGVDRAELLSSLAQHHFMSGDWVESLAALDAAAALFEPADRHNDAAQAHHNAGVVLLLLERADEAIERHRRAAELYLSAWREGEAGACERHVAELVEGRGRHSESLATLESAKARLAAGEHWLEWGRAAFVEARVLSTLGKNDHAAAALDEARRHLIGASAEVAACDLLRVKIDIARRRYAEADSALDRAVAVFEAVDDEDELDVCRFRRAQLLVRTGRESEALPMLDGIRCERQQRGDVKGVGHCHIEAARALRKLGEWDDAKKLTHDAIAVAEASGDKAGEAKALIVQAKLWLDIDAGANAWNCRERAAELFAEAHRPADARRAKAGARRVLRKIS